MMSAISNYRIDLNGVVQKVKTLLQGRPRSIRIFNICLPIRNWILIDDDPSLVAPSATVLPNHEQPVIDAGHNFELQLGITAQLENLLKLDRMLELISKMENLDWLRVSKQELDDLIKPLPICSEKVMAALVGLVVLGMDWNPCVPLFLSTLDFDEFSRQTMLDDEDPILLLRTSKWFFRNPKLGELICEISPPFPEKPRRPRCPIFFLSPFPFPLPQEEIASSTSESSSLHTWACTKFTAVARTIEIHASKSICQLFNNNLEIIVESLNKRLPHALKFWERGRIIVPEDVSFIEIESNHPDVALAMGLLLDPSKWDATCTHVPRTSTKDLMLSIYNAFSMLCDGRAEPKWI